MSPERIVRRSKHFVDYITAQANYNLVSLRSSSFIHNRSEEGESPRALPRGALLRRLRLRHDVIRSSPRLYCCTSEAGGKAYLDLLTMSALLMPPPGKSNAHRDVFFLEARGASNLGENFGLMKMGSRDGEFRPYKDRRHRSESVNAAAWASALVT